MELKSRRILVVEPGRTAFELANDILVPLAAHLTHVPDIDTALHRVRAWKPHLILIDCGLIVDRNDRDSIIDTLRSISSDEYVSVVLLCEEGFSPELLKMLSVGGDDFLIKPLKKNEVIARLSCAVRMRDLHDQLRRSQHRIEELTAIDDLTGLLNMKYLYRHGEDDVARCRRFRKPVTAVLVDIDHFSAINEAHGFPFGSYVIKEVAGLVRSCIRKVDRVARVGADEYFVLLPETDLAGAEFVAERIRDTIQNHEHRSEKEFAKVTVSIGVAGFGIGEEMGSLNDFFRNASEALRSAKVAGANRIEVFSFA